MSLGSSCVLAERAVEQVTPGSLRLRVGVLQVSAASGKASCAAEREVGGHRAVWLICQCSFQTPSCCGRLLSRPENGASRAPIAWQNGQTSKYHGITRARSGKNQVIQSGHGGKAIPDSETLFWRKRLLNCYFSNIVQDLRRGQAVK